jgi:hypothetical protein
MARCGGVREAVSRACEEMKLRAQGDPLALCA